MNATQNGESADSRATGVPTVVFPFDVHYPFAHVSRLFGVRPERARVELVGEHLTAVFGPWTVETTIDNVASTEVSGPYAPLKVVGPAHLSLADGGLTFATNTESGLCLTFRDAVSGLLPLPLVRHRSLTVTVADPEQVQATLDRAIRTWREARDRIVAREGVEQAERDAIHGATTAQLRDRAEALGISHTAEMSHAELVEAMESDTSKTED